VRLEGKLEIGREHVTPVIDHVSTDIVKIELFLDGIIEFEILFHSFVTVVGDVETDPEYLVGDVAKEQSFFENGLELLVVLQDFEVVLLENICEIVSGIWCYVVVVGRRVDLDVCCKKRKKQEHREYQKAQIAVPS